MSNAREFAGRTAIAGLLVIGMLGLTAWTGEVRHITASTNLAVHNLVVAECLGCHSEGGIGQIRLDSSRRIVDNQQLIKRQLIAGAMPPHSYETDHAFVDHARQLNDDDRLLIQEWHVATVIPMMVPKPALRPGDKVVTVNPGSATPIPTVGSDVRRVQVVEAPEWISSIRLEPVASNSLRYSTLAVVPRTELAGLRKVGESSGTLWGVKALFSARLSPGSRAIQWPAAHPLQVPKSAALVLIHHFKPTGKEESQAMRVHFGRASRVANPVRGIEIEHAPFEIKAKKSLETTLEHKFEDGGLLVGLAPEARFFCEEIEVRLGEKTLYHTRRWDFSFAPALQFAQPVRVQKGDVLTAKFHYRNDDRCRMNEGRVPQLVKSGAGPDDEVCRLGLQFVPN